MTQRYHYLTLWYQGSLEESNAAPFGVLVESHADEGREIFGILKIAPSEPSSVSGSVMENLPKILSERIKAAAQQAKGNRPILEEFRSELGWNVYANALEHIDSITPLREVAYRLFAERVDVDDETLTRFRREHIDPTARVEKRYTISLVA